MDNSVQDLQFLDLSELPEGEQAAINGVLHGIPQQGKLLWGTQRYSAPVESNAVEPTVEHYEERVNGDDDHDHEHSVPRESLARAADDAKSLPPTVQDVSPNDVTLIPAHEQHPESVPEPGPPVTVAATGQGVGHVPSHHPQDYLASGLPATMPGGLPAQPQMYMPTSMYGMPANMGYMYNYQGQQGPVIRDPSRGRNRKSSGKPPCEVYNQEAVIVPPMMAMEYPSNSAYYQMTPPFYYDQHQGAVCYPPYMMSYPSYPPMYTEPTTPKGPPEPKKSYPLSYYSPMQHKQSAHSKNEEPKEFKPASVDNRNKCLDKSKPPQSALRLPVRPDKKPVSGILKVEPAESSIDDKSPSSPRPAVRGPPPGRYSAPRQSPQEAPPVSGFPPTVPMPAPAVAPVAAPAVAPVGPVPIPVTGPVAVPVPGTVLHPGSRVPVLSGPPAIVAGPPILCSGVPAESLPGTLPGVLTTQIVAATPLQQSPALVPVAPHAPDVPVQCEAPAAMPAEAERVPPAVAVQPCATSPAVPVQNAKVSGISEVQTTPTPAPLVKRIVCAQSSSYASALRTNQPVAPKGPVASTASAAPLPAASSGDKPLVRAKSCVNCDEQEPKNQSAPPPKLQEKPPSQTAKPPAGAMIKGPRRQDVGRKSMSAVVKSEATEPATVPSSAPNHAAPCPPSSLVVTPGASITEVASEGASNRSGRPQGPARFQDPLPQKSTVTSPIPGATPVQQIPPTHGAKPSASVVSGTAARASDGPAAQMPVAAAKQPAAASTDSQAASVAATAPPANAVAAAPAATPAVRSYAFAVSKSATPLNPAEVNSIMDRSVEENSSSWESKRNSAPVSKPITAPPLPSLSKDPQLFHLGEYLTKYKLNHSPSNLQPRGLSNRSNWCYIHATLQALVACPPFYNLMKSLPHTPKDGNPSESCTPIIDSIVRFIHEFPKGRRGDRSSRAREAREENANSATVEVPVGAAFEPTYVYRMLSAIRSDTFKVEGRQEDAEEFLSCLLNGLHDEMLELTKMVAAKNSESNMANGDVATNGDLSQRWNEMGPKGKKAVVRTHDFGRTPLSDIFRGLLRSSVIRDQAHNNSHNLQPFFTLQLDIEKSKSVNDALERYGSRDMLEGMTCSKTKKEVTAWQQVELEELPPVLLLHLKCFDYKMDGASKICRVVEYPIDLKVPSRSSSSKGGRNSMQKNTYKLFAVVYHDGKEATKGHYIADAYHFGLGYWLRYDDSSVTVVGLEQVLHARQPRVPYLLFYRRQDTCNS